MAIPLPATVVTPGKLTSVPLYSVSNIQAIKFSNGSPYDITVSRFGALPPGTIIPEGVEAFLYADIENQGTIDIFPVDNYGIGGTSIVNMVVYLAGEKLPTDRGYWPVTIPVQTIKATVSSVNTLSNENNAVGTLVIDIGPTPAALNNMINIWNDHFIWSVVQSGVAHQVLKGNVSGTPLQIGQSGDLAEALGNFQIDGTSTLTGDASLGGNALFTGSAKSIQMHDELGTNYTVMAFDATTAEQLNILDGTAGELANIKSNTKVNGTFEATGAATMDSSLVVTGALTATNASSVVSQANTLNGGANLPAGRLGISSDGDILDANSATATFLKSRNSGGVIVCQIPNGTEIARVNSAGILMNGTNVLSTGNSGRVVLQAGAISRFTGFSGTGNGTFNTNLGATPNQITFNPCTVSGSSQTIGGTTAQSSVVTTGAGLAWGGHAWKDV